MNNNQLPEQSENKKNKPLWKKLGVYLLIALSFLAKKGFILVYAVFKRIFIGDSLGFLNLFNIVITIFLVYQLLVLFSLVLERKSKADSPLLILLRKRFAFISFFGNGIVSFQLISNLEWGIQQNNFIVLGISALLSIAITLFEVYLIKKFLKKESYSFNFQETKKED